MQKKSTQQLLDEFREGSSDQLFRTETIAAVLECSVANLVRDRWLQTGIPYIRVGRKIRYRKADVLFWLNDHTHHHGSGNSLKAGQVGGRR